MAKNDGEEKKVDIAAFYEMAQIRAGCVEPAQLVGLWTEANTTLVEQRVRNAVVQCGIVGTVIPDFAQTADGFDRSNQSKGNVAADAFALSLACDPTQLAVHRLRGAGYPDRRLVIPDQDFSCCLEFKATSDWNDGDSNRRVLTSSPAKLLAAIVSNELPESPCHLIGTVIYDRQIGTVIGFRLDFIGPDSLVNVRLEASTSHKLLSQGQHRSIIIN